MPLSFLKINSTGTADRVITCNLNLTRVFEQHCNQKVQKVSCDIL